MARWKESGVNVENLSPLNHLSFVSFFIWFFKKIPGSEWSPNASALTWCRAGNLLKIKIPWSQGPPNRRSATSLWWEAPQSKLWSTFLSDESEGSRERTGWLDWEEEEVGKGKREMQVRTWGVGGPGRVRPEPATTGSDMHSAWMFGATSPPLEWQSRDRSQSFKWWNLSWKVGN